MNGVEAQAEGSGILPHGDGNGTIPKDRNSLLLLLHGLVRSTAFTKVLGHKARELIDWLMELLESDEFWMSESERQPDQIHQITDFEKDILEMILNANKTDRSIWEEEKPELSKDELKERDSRRVLAASLIDGRITFSKYINLFWTPDDDYLGMIVFELLSSFSVDFIEVVKTIILEDPKDRLFDIMHYFWFDAKSFKYARFSGSVLVNITKDMEICKFICNEKPKPKVLEDLLYLFPSFPPMVDPNQTPMLNHAAMALCNLSRCKEFTSVLVKAGTLALRQYSYYITYAQSEKCLIYLTGMMKNCVFNKEYHKWLIEEAEILSGLLWLITGNEQFDAEENKKLPSLVKYAPANKARNPCVAVRVHVLESLLQLCQTRETREDLRSKNVYLILREYHKWETEPKAMTILEDVINILIKTEDEIGVEDFNEIQDAELTDKLKVPVHKEIL